MIVKIDEDLANQIRAIVNNNGITFQKYVNYLLELALQTQPQPEVSLSLEVDG